MSQKATNLDEAVRSSWLSILSQRKAIAQLPAGELRDAMLLLLASEEDLLCGVVEWMQAVREGMRHVRHVS